MPGNKDIFSTADKSTAIFVVILDQEGAYIRGMAYGQNGDTDVGALAVGTGDDIFLVGTFAGTIDFGTGEAPNVPSGQRGLYVAKTIP